MDERSQYLRGEAQPFELPGEPAGTSWTWRAVERLAARRARSLPRRGTLGSRRVEVPSWGSMHFAASVDPTPPDTAPVVLVHGFVVSSVYLRPTGIALSPHHPVLIPDLPGFGRSDAPDEVLDVPGLARALGDFLDVTTLRPPVVVANSFGCQVALRLAAERPDRVSRLVLLGPTLDPEGRSAATQTARWLRNSLLEPPSLGLVLLRDYAAFGARRVPAMIPKLLEDHVEEILADVRAPTLVVRGQRDPIVPRRWADEMAEALPRGRVAEIDGAPHTLNYDVPGAVARVVRAFAAEPDAAIAGDASI